MDKTTLVNKLQAAFNRAERERGYDFDWFKLNLAYEGTIPDLYMLAVSAPNLGGVSCYQKIKEVVHLMEDYMPQERKHIAIVQVFNSKDELIKHIENDLQEDCKCERVLHIDDELIAV